MLGERGMCVGKKRGMSGARAMTLEGTHGPMVGRAAQPMRAAVPPDLRGLLAAT